MGDIRHVWFRYEFQPDVGNLPHIHMLVWTSEIMAKTDDETYFANAALAQNRITADIRTAFAHVTDPRVRARLEASADDYQRHTCNSKCAEPDGSCRYHCPFPECDYPSYSAITFPVPEDLQQLLIDCKLATATASGISLRRELLGGKWSPLRGHGMANVSPFIGSVFQLTGSHSNTQVLAFTVTQTLTYLHLHPACTPFSCHVDMLRRYAIPDS